MWCDNQETRPEINSGNEKEKKDSGGGGRQRTASVENRQLIRPHGPRSGSGKTKGAAIAITQNCQKIVPPVKIKRSVLHFGMCVRGWTAGAERRREGGWLVAIHPLPAVSCPPSDPIRGLLEGAMCLNGHKGMWWSVDQPTVCCRSGAAQRLSSSLSRLGRSWLPPSTQTPHTHPTFEEPQATLFVLFTTVAPFWFMHFSAPRHGLDSRAARFGRLLHSVGWAVVVPFAPDWRWETNWCTNSRH